MNRRDFLLVRTGSHGCTAELSCVRLYMRLVDAQVGGDLTPDEALEGESERAPRFDAGPVADVFDRLRRDLDGVTVLRIVESAWLGHEELAGRLRPVLADFRAKGGVVEIEGNEGRRTKNP
jgi:hypothetical protein